MVTRLWEALGVPRKAIESYQERPKAEIAHAWLVGVADPTEALPAGHVFVTGTVGSRAFAHLGAVRRTAAQRPSHSGAAGDAAGGAPSIFITRSPAIKAADGRMLPAVCERPPAMPLATWEWLAGLPFGAVVFSTAGEGVPLPSTVADGDLDGDLYLVCWERTILQHITPRPADELSNGAAADATAVFVAEDAQLVANDETWLAQVQAHLADTAALRESAHKGRLYNAMRRVQLEAGFDHPDARAYGEAYVQALERPKHGKAITLPKHLHY